MEAEGEDGQGDGGRLEKKKNRFDPGCTCLTVPPEAVCTAPKVAGGRQASTAQPATPLCSLQPSQTVPGSASFQDTSLCPKYWDQKIHLQIHQGPGSIRFLFVMGPVLPLPLLCVNQG